MIRICKIATVVAITKVMVSFGERSACDIEKTRKLFGPEPAEAFSDVPRN